MSHLHEAPRMVTDPDQLHEMAAAVEKENRNFLRYLRYRCDWSDRRLAKLQRETAARLWTEIDCRDCANCCRRLQLQLSPKDCRELARQLGITLKQFQEYCAERHRDGSWYLQKSPCGFLEGNACTIYESRPSRCRGFPYLEGTPRDDISGTLV
jgi:hypothetical protein